MKEVILIAQDLGDYNKDKGFKKVDGLIDLLKSMLEVPGDYWLRLMYLYPDEITDELIALMQSDSRICPYLDMPIQHINKEMLKSMRRSTSKEKIISTIQTLRREIPNVVIRTSLIVGFPGETEEQFDELAEFIKEHPLDNIGIFKFSREPGSHAYDLPNQIPEEIKEQRYHKLMQLQRKVVKKRNAKLVGKKLSVVIEGYHPDSELLLRGRTTGQCPDIDGMVIINQGSEKVTGFGQRYTVKITAVADYDLIGKVE